MNEEQFGSADAYKGAFEVLKRERIPPKHMALLQAHFKAPNHTATWAQLAKSVGYASGNIINLQYGKLASRVARQLGITKPPNGFWLFVLADWAEERDRNGHSAFVLRRPVIDALTQLGVLRGGPQSISLESLESNVNPKIGEAQEMPQCVCCEHSTPTEGSRICPLCGYQFRGAGWDGIDAHWRSQHQGIMTYEQFWHSLCDAHKGQATRGSSMAANSVVGKLRKDLERHGEYVVRANISSGWFAVFPGTWNIRVDAARHNGREGPTLIVYRTNSGDPRDHYAIPYGVARDLLVENTITHSEVNGSRRWNLTLKNGKLHVTHQPGTKDVSEYHGIPLLIEGNGASASRQVPLAFDDSFSILEGIAREVTVMARSRSRKLRDMALKRSHGVCEACGIDFSIILGGKGVRVLQVHHRRQLALQDAPKLTSPDDLAVVCANCHALIHADHLSAMSVEALHNQWCRERMRTPNPGPQADA